MFVFAMWKKYSKINVMFVLTNEIMDVTACTFALGYGEITNYKMIYNKSFTLIII
jgi:hypothetical protein